MTSVSGESVRTAAMRRSPEFERIAALVEANKGLKVANET